MKKRKISVGLLIMSIAIVAIYTTISCSKSEEQPGTDLNSGSHLKASTAEVTLSGSTWTGKVDGTTKYTGTDMFAAANACIAAMSSGTVNLRNSGNSGSSGGAVKYIRLGSNITLNGNGCTITGNSGDDLIVPVYAKNVSNIGVTNLNIRGRIRYGVWFQNCNGMNVSNCTQDGASLCPVYRMDTGGGGLNIQNCSAKNASASQSMGIETYSLNGVTIGTFTATNLGGCGICLNASTNCTVGTVNATSCDYGGGYAGFRCANSNGKTTVGTVNSTSCGRGFFSCTSSHDCTISKVNATNCSGIGIWIQDSPNTIVNSGTIGGCGGGCWSITGSSSGSAVHVHCNSNP